MIKNLKYLKIMLKLYFIYKMYMIISLNKIKNISKMIFFCKQNHMNINIIIRNKIIPIINSLNKNYINRRNKIKCKMIILSRENQLNNSKITNNNI